ncbi:EF-hand domain-containing protein [Thalassospira australica]|uniref:EF-hand domain-containing protein n=1 Tax=Thalassospira australica TaxID=1528106 RepID=UPI00051A87D4|nr:EF-hand domain-containing protein [Thalassospira australica]
MSNINGTGGNITQIQGLNNQRANAPQDTDGAFGTEAFGSYSSFSLQNTGANSAAEMSDLTSQSEALTGQLSNSIMAMLLELQQTSTATDGSSSFDAQQLFSDMDTDGDGTLTKTEFMEAAPEVASDEMSENLWNLMAGSETDSMSEDDYLAAMKPPGGMPPKGQDGEIGGMTTTAGSAMAEDGTFDPLDTNEDGTVSLSEIMAVAPQDASPSQSSLPSSTSDEINSGSENFNSKLMAQVIA